MIRRDRVEIVVLVGLGHRVLIIDNHIDIVHSVVVHGWRQKAAYPLGRSRSQRTVADGSTFALGFARHQISDLDFAAIERRAGCRC